ncbi:restriction endonuclease subunit S [Pseudomonas sp. RGM2987]|uniref:restriction endonuclease subunit S n=1 Tax=Pseudomonas sp. RGM2987 TaxID=2930090 RepID=UPI001FD6D157|nr:restriction endonuclease subunit S [Pseudomonas sp. RGM2987]MCJ8207271.1 restriction endonuclease subunit S [Pseudomonas sp. RGM2987]
MANELATLTLEDCLEALIDYRGKTPRKTDFGIPLITAKVVKSGRIEPPNEFIAEEDYGAWMTRGYPQIGDVVLTTEAPLGEVAQIKFLPVALAQRIVTLRGKRDLLDSSYLLYLMQSQEMQAKLLGRSSGTTVIGIKQSELRKIQVALPPIAEQRSIAHILSTLDEKIEINRKQNETLEAMAHALFQAWFVDFEPVRAKLEGRWQRSQCLPGLPAPLWDLFPDRLVESDLREIPEGWESVPASRLVEFNPSEQLRKETEAPYIEMAALPTAGSWPEPPVLRPFGSGMRFRNGDTLLARITPCLENGKTAFVQSLPDNTVGWGSTEYIVMRPKAPVPAEFGYLLARDAAFREQAIRSMTGTSGRQRVQSDSVAAFKLAAPSNEAVWDAFSGVVAPVFKNIKANAEAIATLAQLRDTLLPKLISGELRLLDAERIVGA